MDYSTRLCHFAEQPYVKARDKVKPGTILGKIGDTGKSDGIHCHIDSIVGLRSDHWRVADFEAKRVLPANEQSLYLIGQNDDIGLFEDSLPFISAPIMSAYYRNVRGKDHYGNDVIPVNKNSEGILHWNRSRTGIVLFSGFDVGYGWSVIIGFKG